MNRSELTRVLAVAALSLLVTACSSDLAKADTSAQRFVRLLDAGDDDAARAELKHFGPKQPTASNLRDWWSGCTQQSGRAKRWRLVEWKMTEGVGTAKQPSAQLRYDLEKTDNSKVPLFFSMKLEQGDWLIFNFACPMLKPKT